MWPQDRPQENSPFPELQPRLSHSSKCSFQSAHTQLKACCQLQHACPATSPCGAFSDSHIMSLPGCNTRMPAGLNCCSSPPSWKRKLILICLPLLQLLPATGNGPCYFSPSNLFHYGEAKLSTVTHADHILFILGHDLISALHLLCLNLGFL